MQARYEELLLDTQGDGEILDENSQDAAVRGTRALYAVMGAEPRVIATAIQTVGSKGYDGFAIARVR